MIDKKPVKSSKTIGIAMPEALIKAARSRSSVSLSEGIRESLARYYALLKIEREGMRGMFTAGELKLLADANNGTRYEPRTIARFDANALHAGQEKYDYFGVDREALDAKLKKLTLVQLHVLVDAIERFWESVAKVKGVADLEAADPSKLLDN